MHETAHCRRRTILKLLGRPLADEQLHLLSSGNARKWGLRRRRTETAPFPAHTHKQRVGHGKGHVPARMPVQRAPTRPCWRPAAVFAASSGPAAGSHPVGPSQHPGTRRRRQSPPAPASPAWTARAGAASPRRPAPARRSRRPAPRWARRPGISPARTSRLSGSLYRARLRPEGKTHRVGPEFGPTLRLCGRWGRGGPSTQQLMS
jgi:hypothetical protein